MNPDQFIPGLQEQMTQDPQTEQQEQFGPSSDQSLPPTSAPAPEPESIITSPDEAQALQDLEAVATNYRHYYTIAQDATNMVEALAARYSQLEQEQSSQTTMESMANYPSEENTQSGYYG